MNQLVPQELFLKKNLRSDLAVVIINLVFV